MKWLTKWFIGPHRELKRPANDVDYSLLERIEAKRRELDSAGVQVKAVRGRKYRER